MTGLDPELHVGENLHINALMNTGLYVPTLLLWCKLMNDSIHILLGPRPAYISDRLIPEACQLYIGLPRSYVHLQPSVPSCTIQDKLQVCSGRPLIRA